MPTPNPSAVRFYAPDHPALLVTARARIEAERKIRIEQLGTGYATSWEDYHKRAGVITGFDIALGMIDTVEKELSERNRA
jgi:hypothetical protein